MPASNVGDEKLKAIYQLEGLASQVLQLKNETRPRRPIVIEFCGSPKSGKTTTMTSLQIFLKRNGLRTRTLTERASVCPVPDKEDPNFNLWTSTSAISELVESMATSGTDTDVIIADRGIFDALCWFTWLHEHNKLRDDDHEAIVRFLTSPLVRSPIDLVLVFTAGSEVSMKREYAGLLTRKPGSIMNERTLESYLLSISNATERYGKYFRSLVQIDTSNEGQSDVNYMVTEQVLGALTDVLEERVGGLPRPVVESAFGDRLVIDIGELTTGSELLTFGRRSEVEANLSVVQPIPVVVLLTHDHQKILVLKKRSQSTPGKSPEGDRLLVYSGGHVRQEDQAHGEEDLMETLSRTLVREAKEELGVSLPVGLEAQFAVWDRTHPRSEHHMAVVCVYVLRPFEQRIKMDGYEFAKPRSSSAHGKFRPIDEVLTQEVGSQMEAWSRLIVEELLRRDYIAGQLQFSLT
jgi:ADP-ribose pyrophosphatase YjhB (NUDIX family)